MLYTLITTEKGDIPWKGYSCSSWTHTKKIVGSFWIGSFDATFEKKTILLNDAECWNMALERTCAGNQMRKEGNNFQYVDPPKGEGKWYSEVQHTVINCVLQELTFLLTSGEKNVVETPLGTLNVETTATTALINLIG